MIELDDEPVRGVFAQIDPATGEVRQWCVCFEPPQVEGFVAVELPFQTDVHTIIGRRVNMASIKQRDGKPPLAILAAMDS